MRVSVLLLGACVAPGVIAAAIAGRDRSLAKRMRGPPEPVFDVNVEVREAVDFTKRAAKPVAQPFDYFAYDEAKGGDYKAAAVKEEKRKSNPLVLPVEGLVEHARKLAAAGK